MKNVFERSVPAYHVARHISPERGESDIAVRTVIYETASRSKGLQRAGYRRRWTLIWSAMSFARDDRLDFSRWKDDLEKLQGWLEALRSFAP